MTRGVRVGVLFVTLWGASGTVRAAEQNASTKSLGLHLVDDFAFKWKSAIPEFEAFAPDESPGWDAWGVAQADASIPNRTGRLKLGLGIGRLGLGVDSTTIVEGTAARVRVRLDLAVGAGRLALQLPDVKVTPRYDKGQLTFDWVVPIIEERF